MAFSDQVQIVPRPQSLSDQFVNIDALRISRSTDNANLVRSFIRDRGLPSRPTEINPDAIIVLGTATQGVLFNPQLFDPFTAEDEFGAIPIGPLRETSLVKGCLEVYGSIQNARTDVRAVRVGNANKAQLQLPERGLNEGFARFQGGPVNQSDRAIVDAARRKISIVLESIEEGDRFNRVTVNIENRSTLSGIIDPDYLVMTFSNLPNGETVTLDNLYIGDSKSIRSNPANIINSAQLATRINTDPILSQYLTARVFFLDKEIEIMLTDEDGNFDTTKRVLRTYDDINPLHVAVIDPDVDRYLFVDVASVVGQPGVYGATDLATASADEIVHTIILRNGISNDRIENSGNFSDVIDAADVGKIVCIRPYDQDAENDLTIPQSVKDIYGYYIITQAGTAAGTSPSDPISPRFETVPLPSWGDNLSFIRGASFLSGGDFRVGAGQSTTTFTSTPRKVLNEEVSTIDSFIRRVPSENVLVVTPAIDLSQPDVNMILQYINEGSYSTTGTFTSIREHTISGVTQVIADLPDVFLVRAGATSAITNQDDLNPNGLVEGVHYSFDRTSGTLTWHQDYTPVNSGDPIAFPLQLGDRVFTGYRYQVNYEEAKLRSQLIQGNPTVYFVTGPTIIFGAAQQDELEISFKSQDDFTVSQVSIIDEIEFSIAFNRNDLIPTDKVSLRFAYTPELPGPPEDVDEVNDGGIFQLSGGSDGTYGPSLEDKTRYKEELIRAYRLIENWPCRTMLPVGAYLDDRVTGFNFETGLPEPRNAGFHFDLLNAVNRKSLNVRECVGYIATRPPNTTNIGAVESVRWTTNHIIIDPNDPTRPANVISQFGGTGPASSFRLACVVGTPLGTLSGQAGTSVMNPAFIYAGMKEDLFNNDLDKSMVNMPVPFNQQIVLISSLEDISELNRFRYTSMVWNVQEQQVIIADAPTLALPNSQFTRQYVLDVTEKAINLVREVAQSFIGRPRRTEELTAMRARMGLALKKMVPINLISYTVDIADVPDGHITGKVKVRLFLTTAVEIRSIDIETEIRLGS